MAGLNYITASFREEIKHGKSITSSLNAAVELALRRHFRMRGHIEAVQRPSGISNPL